MTIFSSAESTGASEQSSNQALNNFNDLSDAYNAMAVRNVATFTDAMTAISAVKNSSEMLTIQQRFAKESMETAVETGRKIGGLFLSALMSAVPQAGWLSPSVPKPAAL